MLLSDSKLSVDKESMLSASGAASNGGPAHLRVDTTQPSPAPHTARPSEDGDGSEALRILEGLKAKQGLNRCVRCESYSVHDPVIL